MAMPGHSPPFNGPSSPPRTYTGYPDHQHHQPMFGPARTMLPPSPQHFPPPRFSQPPPTANSAAIGPHHGPPPPHKRPGSSMSISSMLGTEPERPPPEHFHNHNQPPRPPSGQYAHQGPSMSLGAVMSPPHYSSKPNTTEYSYKPRSKTPDRAAGHSMGARAHRSHSGTMTQRPGPFYEPPRSQPNPNAFHESKYNVPFGPAMGPRDDFEDRARRTSIGGILQRPESQPQATHMSPSFGPTSHPLSRPETIPPSLVPIDRLTHQPVHGHDAPRSNGGHGHYDTRPPGFTPLTRIPQSAPSMISGPLERPSTLPLSPELRRPHPNGGEGRLAGILNQQGESVFGGQNMMRQDSVQSQGDRSVQGDRLRTNRPYSPFAGSVASGPLDDPGRKGSEELSQHRAILSLANESKRGRFSPVPQAVQGAQAQTPAPDAGIKTEHGRVFAGIGSGMGAASAGPTPTPLPLPASAFKRDDGGARLSEENLMKMSRSTSGINKRSRKVLDESKRAESDVGDAKKGAGRGKRSKYAHAYKVELDDTLGQRKTFPTSNPSRRVATPTSNPSQALLNAQPQLVSSITARPPSKKKQKLIKISKVVGLAASNPRRHLGSFQYDPQITPSDHTQPLPEKFDVSVRPKLLPSYRDPAQINCTYTVKVSSLWLQPLERRRIGKEQYLWGSGIYTDDSDPVATAMHAGFIASASLNDAVSEPWLEELNPTIEGSPAPGQPAPVPEGKDLHITLVVLPQLQSYTDTVRFGIKSRSWPPGAEGDTRSAPHDGVSFMVLKTEFLNDGIQNRRIGRTGVDKRKRLHKELEDRRLAFEFRDRRWAELDAREKEKKAKAKQQQQTGQGDSIKAPLQTEEPTLLVSAEAGHPKQADGKENHVPNEPTDDQSKGTLGEDPDAWMNQVYDKVNAVMT